MINKKNRIIILLLSICLLLIPFCVQASSTSDAVEPIIPENRCSLNISYRYGEIAFSDMQVKLYRVAEVSSAFRYSLTRSFISSNLMLNKIQSAGEWNVVRSTLEAYIIAYAVEPDAVLVTDTNGQVDFEDLDTGLYLAVVGQAVQDDLCYEFDSALVSLPGLLEDGYWQYDVLVNAKGELLPPVDPDEQTEFKVTKLWKADEGKSSRPKSVEVEIFCNQNSYKTVVLSDENHWSYSWSAKSDNSSWTVVERGVPQGYSMTVESKDGTFVLTNVWIDHEDPSDPPKTGDTANILLYAFAMSVSGVMLIVLGVTRKRTDV